MRKMLLYTMILLISLSALQAQIPVPKFGSYFKALHQDHQLSGNVAIMDQSRIIYRRSFGCKDYGAGAINDANSQFELASVSKLFTATCVLQLKDHGRLNLDDPFQHYFSEFPYATITIRHLLSHTSGLPDTEGLLDSLISRNPQQQFTIQDELPAVITYSKGHRLLFEPGERWSYSSAGYHLLALLVGKQSGQAFATYLQDHIFKPAGMGSTYLQTNMAQKAGQNRTKNYQYNNHFEQKLQFVDTLNDWKEWTYNLALMVGGGGIVSTTGDLLKFDRALTDGKLLSKNAQIEAYTPYKLNNGQSVRPLDIAYCGLGWFISTDSSQGRMVWGSGANPGTISFFSRNIDRPQCVVILHNIKSNGFQDLMAVDLLHGKDVRYKASLGFIYVHDLWRKGQAYADAHLKQLQPDTANYELREADLDRASLELKRVGARTQVMIICDLHVKLFPKSTDAYRDRTSALEEYGRKPEAILDYEQAIALDPNDTKSKQALRKLNKN